MTTQDILHQSDLSGLPFDRAIMFLRETETETDHAQDEPKELPLKAITELHQVFQVRDATLHEQHLGVLGRSLSMVGDLDPIDVWRCGTRVFLLDGHHRLEAYRRAHREKIPIRMFKGSFDDALRHAEQSNVKTTLPMSLAEKSNHAWKLTVNGDVLGKLSKAEIMRRTGVSKGTIDNMRKALEVLGRSAKGINTWYQAQRRWKEISGEPIESTEDWRAQEAEKLAERLGKIGGKKLATRPDVTALAFREVLGRMTPEIAVLMLEECGLMARLYNSRGEEVDDLSSYEPVAEEPIDPGF